MMRVAQNWQDYEVVASGDGEKLERWGALHLLRPEPQAIWRAKFDLKSFEKLDAHYLRDSSGGGRWHIKREVPKEWITSLNDLKFNTRLMGFKHTGIFPEQAVNWQLMQDAIRGAKQKAGEIKVLNLFAYTGAASVACAKEGASVCHVDASKGMVAAAGENARLNNLTNIRFIIEDCKKFVMREIRRQNRYDALLMDPPSYGRGPNGEIWKLEDSLFDLVELCSKVVSDNPLFFLINSYTTGLAPTVLKNILDINLGERGGASYAYEVGLPTREGIVLPCGSSGLYLRK